MRVSLSLSLLRSLSFSLHHHRLPCSLPTFNPHRFSSAPLASSSSATSHSNFVKHSASEDSSSEEEEWDYWGDGKEGSLSFDLGVAGSEMIRHMGAPSLKVKELEELPGEWRRSKLTWLCKELPALAFVQCRFLDSFSILNATRKWLRQEDATYVVVHFIRIGEYEAAHWVYNWMQGQDWYRFDFALATKLANSMGKQQKCVPNKCRFDKACGIYNGMIHQGGYQPHLNVYNSLFRALISKLGGSSKRYLKQVELIFHNLVTSGLEIPKEVYVGLIWLHSYQRTVDKERIASLREEMRQVGIEEGKEVLLSVLRVCSKEEDVEEVERICLKLLDSNDGILTQAFVYKMVAYAKIGEFTKSLDTFREMQKLMGSTMVPEYRELVEVLCKAENTKLAESVMDEFVKSGMKPPLIMPSYINISNLNLGMPDRLHLAFFEYENILVYNIYLESFIKAGNVEKADEVFNQMQSDEAIGIDARSCNTMLSGYLSSCNTISSGYLSSEKYNKVDELFDLMVDKDYDVEPWLDSDLDYVLTVDNIEGYSVSFCFPGNEIPKWFSHQHRGSSVVFSLRIGAVPSSWVSLFVL
ncbi:hypothetical protein EZV62_011687 [Acer yangbiense]|uniref:Pentacotripeptide-repeat region of PRORP domain-containing protein n=1 Tax=Acer yangbiense TaxID=1000413 RepID=A0A5C7I5A4_9ROSI|nr:hypothetical protein EZV62_011687 [Acer yangbiense]